MNQYKRIMNDSNAQVIEVGGTIYKGKPPTYQLYRHPLTQQLIPIKVEKGIPYVKVM